MKRDSGKILVLSACAAAIIFAVLISPLCIEASNLGQFFFPLPFPGPYSGTVVDSEKENPIPGAIVEIQWMLHDNPLPDGVGHYPITATGETDRNGVFYLKKQEARGGFSQTDLSIKITAKGYIERMLIIDPKGRPLPQQTIDYPFADASIHKSPPEPLNVRLKPALPVILKALQSKDPLIKWKAEEEFRKLKNTPAVSP